MCKKKIENLNCSSRCVKLYLYNTDSKIEFKKFGVVVMNNNIVDASYIEVVDDIGHLITFAEAFTYFLGAAHLVKHVIALGVLLEQLLVGIHLVDDLQEVELR